MDECHVYADHHIAASLTRCGTHQRHPADCLKEALQENAALKAQLAKAMKVVGESQEVLLMFGDDFSPSATWKGFVKALKGFDGGGE